MVLRVAMDVTSAVTQRAGVARYTRELIHALQNLPDSPELCPFFASERVVYPLEAGVTPIRVRHAVRPWYIEMLARHACHQPASGPWDNAQVYHALDVAYPPVRRVPVVTTIHDLSYVVYPRYHTRLNGAYMRLLTPTLTRRARIIIADSGATKCDLIERIGVPERKIRVVHLGVSDVFSRVPTPERVMVVRERYGLAEPFILSVGTLEPRKNLAGTLHAYRLLRQRLPDAPCLVLVGGSGWGIDERRLVGAENASRVRRLAYLPDEDVAALYAACSAFVYPSFYEGFGLPVAEAMALGAPTITSRVSSLPEVAGDAALLIDPHDPDEIAAALERVLVDDELSARLRADGPVRAGQFTYERCAAQTMRVYEESIAG